MATNRVILKGSKLAAGLAVVAAGLLSPLAASAYTVVEPMYYYYGAHPVPEEWGGGWCTDEGFHAEPFAPGPDEMEFYAVQDGYFIFIGDPTFYDGYAGEWYWYYGSHPADFYVYDHVCYIDGPHVHMYAPSILWLDYYYWDSYTYVWYGPWPSSYVPHHVVYLNTHYPNHWAGHHRHQVMAKHYKAHPPMKKMPPHKKWGKGKGKGQPTPHKGQHGFPKFKSAQKGGMEMKRASKMANKAQWSPVSAPREKPAASARSASEKKRGGRGRDGDAARGDDQATAAAGTGMRGAKSKRGSGSKGRDPAAGSRAPASSEGMRPAWDETRKTGKGLRKPSSGSAPAGRVDSGRGAKPSYSGSRPSGSSKPSFSGSRPSGSAKGRGSKGKRSR